MNPRANPNPNPDPNGRGAEAEHLRDLERVVGVEGADGVEAGQQIVVEVELA